MGLLGQPADFAGDTIDSTNCRFAKSGAVPTLSDDWEIGVVPNLLGLPEVSSVVSGYVRQEGAQGHFGPLERPRSPGSGQVEAVGFLNELGQARSVAAVIG